MSEPTRQEMLSVLAERGMGWEVHTTLNPSGRKVTWAMKSDASVVYLAPEVLTCSEWAPDTDWGGAGELWEAMRKKPPPVWRKFCEAVGGRSGTYTETFLWYVIPAHIARAAFEALETEHV